MVTRNIHKNFIRHLKRQLSFKNQSILFWTQCLPEMTFPWEMIRSLKIINNRGKRFSTCWLHSAYSCCALSVNTGMFMIHLMSEIVIGDEFVASLKLYCVSVKTWLSIETCSFYWKEQSVYWVISLFFLWSALRLAFLIWRRPTIHTS